MVDRTAQGFPAQGSVRAVELSHEIPGRSERAVVVSARVRNAEVEIGGFGDVTISPQVLDGADVAALLLLKYIAGVAAEELAGDIQEKSFGRGKNTLD